ncbi:hypothetical protein GPLA_4756 [Paraglaciecola polaris LMG 21857]|uniref:Uncharacterized protein n=1 Tax=Paraglaciecola polaris LMG 21857 TaxID=1129793 RepID=K7AJU0_9ALTE|nr:hypothetical protein GPLA_4756 [Paraglaciecola polaris LMG 21857]
MLQLSRKLTYFLTNTQLSQKALPLPIDCVTNKTAHYK